MPRKRFSKGRKDYRSGGRVRYDAGGAEEWRQRGNVSIAGSGRYYAGGTKTPKEAQSYGQEMGYELPPKDTKPTYQYDPSSPAAGFAAGTIGAQAGYAGSGSGRAMNSHGGGHGQDRNGGGRNGGGNQGNGETVDPNQEAKEALAAERLERMTAAGPRVEDITLGDIGAGEDKGIARVDPGELARVGDAVPLTRTERPDLFRQEHLQETMRTIDPLTGRRRTDIDPVAATAKVSDTDEIVSTVAEEAVKQAADVTRDAYDPATVTAAQVGEEVTITGAEGILSEGAKAKVDEIRELSGPAEAQMITDAIVNSAKADNVDAVISAGAYVPSVTGIGEQVSATPDAEKNARTAITGTEAVGAEAQIIDVVGYEAHQRSEVKGEARAGAAATMVAQTAAIPQDIAAAIVEDPSVVEAQIDTEPVEVQAAIAALPTEALVSSQMETLVGGLESGDIPAWAKPAVAAMNQNLAARGMEISTVGRDALFNSIIQSALPIAQSNAQALQARAAQNLSNEQQANLAQSTQDMQRRMANLSNQQTAASQTASNAQQMATMQSQFRQEAVLTTAQQQQQTRIQNLQNQQQASVMQAQNAQQMAMQNLGNEQQMEMANLQIEAEREGANQAAINQERMAEMQVAADFLVKNAGFKQQMDLANLSTDQQMKLANLSALNQASSENLTAEQQTDLADLNKRMQINIKNGELANAMGLAQLNVDQQRAMQNAGMVANMDMTKFTTEQQVELANSKWMQTAGLTNLNNEQQAALQDATALASLDLATLDQRTKISAQHAQAFLQMDMANLSNDQQATILSAQQKQQRMLSNQAAANAAEQFNASSENQVNQFLTSLGAQIDQQNVASQNAMLQFNASNENAAEARRMGREADISKFNAQLETQVSESKAQKQFLRDQFNAQNAQVIEQSNVEFMRKVNTADTAARNAAITLNAQNAMTLSSQQLAFLSQELRDEAQFDATFADNERERLAQVYAAALGSTTYNNNSGQWTDILAAFGNILE